MEPLTSETGSVAALSFLSSDGLSDGGSMADDLHVLSPA